MLTDSDRDQILAEERYRVEIRSQLAKETAQPKSSRAWTFVNSSFGLWLLSAVFITGAGAAWSAWQARQTRTRETQDLIGRLDLEISHRFSLVLSRLEALTDGGDYSHLIKPHTVADVRGALDILSTSGTVTYVELYPEFAKRGTPSLVAELRQHVTLTERASLDSVLVAISDTPFVHAYQLENIQTIGSKIIETVVSKRPTWVSSGFPYTDCSRQVRFPT